MTEADTTTKPPKTWGEKIATLGAAMFAISIILAFAGVSGAMFHNIMQLGGIVLGIVGVIMWKVLKK
ncbi:MAG: hypothetical protein SF172_12780 [Burkholderiales bacterium]|nr:hypothetical protein [Burkholderiales bacterium]